MSLPVLHTERLHIRPWRPADANAFHAIWGDPEVIWWGAMEGIEASRDPMGQATDLGEGLGWAAMVSAAGEIVGNVALQPAKPDGRPDVEVGWHLARAHWGQGYATEAAAAVIEHGFSALGLQRVVADIVPGNQRSQAVARRLGMQPVEQVERSGLLHDVWAVQRA